MTATAALQTSSTLLAQLANPAARALALGAAAGLGLAAFRVKATSTRLFRSDRNGCPANVLNSSGATRKSGRTRPRTRCRGGTRTRRLPRQGNVNAPFHMDRRPLRRPGNARLAVDPPARAHRRTAFPSKRAESSAGHSSTRRQQPDIHGHGRPKLTLGEKPGSRKLVARSRGAAPECSPRRKPRESLNGDEPAPAGRKINSHPHKRFITANQNTADQRPADFLIVHFLDCPRVRDLSRRRSNPSRALLRRPRVWSPPDPRITTH